MRKMLNKINPKYLIFIIVFITVVIVAMLINKNYQPEKLEYIKFTQMVEEGKVEEIDLRDSSNEMFVISTDDVKYITNNPRTELFKQTMLDEGISVVNKKPLNKSASAAFGQFLQIGIFALIGFLVYNIMKTTMKSKTTMATEEESNIRFKDIAGHQEAKGDMEFLVSFLKNPDKYKEMGAKLPKGVVLYGPPGTGKTLMAKAVAGEAGVPFFYATGSDFIEMYVGLGAKRVRDLFEKAKEHSPCIVFIDEIDAVGTHRGATGRSSENDQTINALLSELDGFGSDESVIVMVATNRLEDLDDALIRPGRFDRHVNIGLPDFEDRHLILKNYAKGKKIGIDINLESLAKITMGFSGASLEALMNEAAIIAVNKGSEIIRPEDIDDSYFKITMKGDKKITKNPDKDEVLLVAYHEAGHTLATKLLTDNHLHKVTIIPSTSGAGGATFSVPKTASLISKRAILDNIMILYAGRAAEEILRNDKDLVTSGASSDIQQATKYIKAYFSELGMSEKFGMMAIDNDELYLDEAVELSKKLYEDVLLLLNNNRKALDLISSELVLHETLTGDEVDDLISKNRLLL